MAKDQVAGAIILDTLRERIVSGLYVGHWRPGERLPSIREIAEAEGVDRKTAAAAYHRLEEEGLVRVRPRSGVYLCAPPQPAAPGPLERLHRQWLLHTFEGARSLGLETRTIQRLINAVSELEQVRLPVVECNWPQAESLASELRQRLGVQALPCLLEDLAPGDPLIAEAPVLVTTPYHAAELALIAQGKTVLEATLTPDLLREIDARARRSRILVVAGDERHARKVQRAIQHCRQGEDPVPTMAVTDRQSLGGMIQGVDAVFLWPGTPGWVDEAIPATVQRIRPRRCIAADAISRIQVALLDAALRRAREFSRSTDAAAQR